MEEVDEDSMMVGLSVTLGFADQTGFLSLIGFPLGLGGSGHPH